MHAQDFVDGVMAGQRRALAKTITLIESRRSDHQQLAQQVLTQLLPHTGGAVRIGVSGVPGVGKSTFIEALGVYLVELGQRVAVLAVDPSSRRTGGSIMGDKTRMERLATDSRAYIRPSPTGGSLGGVARKTREAMLVCEAAGYDVILVETVGVGQSEVAVADMVDFFALLILPGAGDALQGIKRGIVELADAIFINKSEQNPQLAERAEQDYSLALELLTPSSALWRPRVLRVSARKKTGIQGAWEIVLAHNKALGKKALEEKRQQQAVHWMRSLLEDEMWHIVFGSKQMQQRYNKMVKRVQQHQIAPTQAALDLIGDFLATTG